MLPPKLPGGAESCLRAMLSQLVCRHVDNLRERWGQIRRGSQGFDEKLPSADSASEDEDALETLPLAARLSHLRAKQALQKGREKQQRQAGRATNNDLHIHL